jgi:hypothetical protein
MDYKCLRCSRDVFNAKGTAGKYCSNKCQHEHQHYERVDSWLKNNTKIGKSTARRYLTETTSYKCSCCNLDSWLGNSIVLEIDHTDGNPFNNRPENLRWICPNCHSQTPTYKNRNKGNGRVLNPNKDWLLV